MFSLQSLRNAPRLARLVLVWFAFFVGVAVASPLVKPEPAQMVCTGMGGMKWVLDQNSPDATVASEAMACPLCAQVVTPPSSVVLSFKAPSEQAYALRPTPCDHIAWMTGSPLPPRGPPAFS